MCPFEALLTTDFDDENKYNTKPIDEREECWILFSSVPIGFLIDQQAVSLVQKELWK